MELTKANIVNRINKQAVNYRITWDDIVDDLDEAIEEINSYMSTKYPPVSKILDYNSPSEKTYSFRAGGVDVNFFPEKYFTSIVISFVITKILTRDEEFTTIFSYHSNRYQENLFIMARDEMNSIPYQFISAPKGVYFANPDPSFKQDPEKYFNRAIILDVPKIKVYYSWGNYASLIDPTIQTFVEKPLPVDNNSYEMGTQIMPIMMKGEGYSTFIVDFNQRVLGVFLGWSLSNDNNANGIINEPITLNEDLNLYAVFDLDIVGIKYLGNGGTVHNWQPVYLTKEQVENETVSPVGGTAVRKGYRFLGFIPEREYTPNLEETETEEEPDLIFKANWYKVLYNISYEGTENGFVPKKTGYTFGQEFYLETPESDPYNPDNFIGWWDNPYFTGSNITKINESDYGDKTFYAKYNKESYRVRWLQEDGELIREEFYTKGSLIVAPESPTKPRYTDQNGLLFVFEFLGFYNEYGEKFQPGILKVQRNTTYVASFSQPIPVMEALILTYNKDDSNSDVLTFVFQVGRKVFMYEIINEMIEKNIFKYTEDSLIMYVSEFEYYLNEVQQVGNLTNEDFITVDENIVISLKAVYTESSFKVTIKNKTFSNMTLAIGDTQAEINFPENTTKSSIEMVALNTQNMTYRFSVAYNAYIYIQGFKVLANIEGVETEIDMPEYLDGDIIIVPFYGTVENIDFYRTLTLNMYPNKDAKTTSTKTINYKYGTIIQLTDLILETQNNVFKYLEIDGFYKQYSNGIFSGQIFNTIEMTSNQSVYVKTKTKKIAEIAYYNLQGVRLNTIGSLELFPFMFPNGFYSFNTVTNQPTSNPGHPLGDGFVFKGWNRLVDQTIVETNISIPLAGLESLESLEYKLYPVYWRLGDFIVNFQFVTTTGIAPETNYSLNSTLTKTYPYYYRNNLITMFETYYEDDAIGSPRNFITALKQESNYPSAIANVVQRGYSFYGYRQGPGSLNNSMPIRVDLTCPQSDIENMDKVITIQIVLERRPWYILTWVIRNSIHFGTYQNLYEGPYDKFFIQHFDRFFDVKQIFVGLSDFDNPFRFVPYGNMYMSEKTNYNLESSVLLTDIYVFNFQNYQSIRLFYRDDLPL